MLANTIKGNRMNKRKPTSLSLVSRISLSYLLVASLFFLPQISLAVKKNNSAKNIVSVTDVLGESSKKISMVTISLNKRMHSKDDISLTDHGRYIQIDMQNVIAAKPGSFYESNSPYLAKMALFETSEGHSALRIFTEEDAEVIKKSSDVDLLGNRIIYTLDHDLLRKTLDLSSDKESDKEDEGLRNKTAATTASSEDKTLVEDGGLAVTSTATPSLSSAPNEGQPKSTASAPPKRDLTPATSENETLEGALTAIGAGRTAVDLSKNLKTVAGFIGFMFVLLLLSLTFKRFKRNAFLAQRKSGDALRTLGTLALNPKQQLNLVEVGGEKILLSVSSDAVSLISHIGGQQAAAIGPSDVSQRRQLPPASDLENSAHLANQRTGLSETLSVIRKKAAAMEGSNGSPSSSSKFDDVINNGGAFSPKRNLSNTQSSPTARQKSRPTKGQAPSQRSTGSMKPKATGSNINVKISDEGVSKVGQRKDELSQDVTSLIREKLKSLPKF